MHNIKDDIKKGILSNVYILCGEEEYLTDYYKNEIISFAVENDTKDFNLMAIYSILPPPEEIDSFSNSYPFMSDKKVLIIENTGIFKNITEEYKSFFIELIRSVPDYLTIVFAEKNIDKRNSLYKEISKIYPVCEYQFQPLPTLANWLVKLLSSHGKTISKDDALYMCEISGPSMLSLKSEAEKLISYCKDTDKIDRTVIDSLVTKSIENRVFDMLDDIAASRKAAAIDKLMQLKALNEEPVKIINIIFGKFSTYHKLLVLKGRPLSEICSLTGLFEKHARGNLRQAEALGTRKIASVMTKCRDMDFAIKNSSCEKWLALETIIAEAMKSNI